MLVTDEIASKRTVASRSFGRWQYPVLCGVLMSIGVFMRFWQIGKRPGMEWDEPVYASIARNLADSGLLQAKGEYGVESEPYLYHPPFYFLELAGWFKAFGAGITQARQLAAIMSIGFLVLLYLFLKRELGKWALLPVALVAIDGWLVFTARISWMENSVMVLVVMAVWLYAKAMERPTATNFVVAGLMIGVVAIYKHLGLFLLLAVLINWAIQQREHRQHVGLLVTATAVVATYVVIMLLFFNRSGQNYYWDHTLVQVDRVFGDGDRRGTIDGTSSYIEPLFRQYRVFIGTILAVLASLGFMAWRIVACVRNKSWGFVRDRSLLLSWALAAIICLGASNLKLPHYFVLILVPLYAYASVEVITLLCTGRRETVRLVCAGISLIALMNVLAFQWRIVGQTDNALMEVGRYASAELPADAIVITEESIGTVIQQQYCKLWRTAECSDVATYIITYETYTQKLPDNPALDDLLRNSTAIKTIEGFKETLTVWHID